MTENIRVVVLNEGDVFYGQCLEYDVAAQADSVEELKGFLRVALRAEAELAAESGRTLADIGPAPAFYHDLYRGDVDVREQLEMKAA